VTDRLAVLTAEYASFALAAESAMKVARNWELAVRMENSKALKDHYFFYHEDWS